MSPSALAQERLELRHSKVYRMEDRSAESDVPQTGGDQKGTDSMGSPEPETEQRPRSPATLERLLADKEAQAARSAKQLQHYRSWVASVHLRVQHMNPKAIQNAKRLYIGNLPQNVTEEELCVFLNQLMQQTGAQIGPDPAVIQCHITQERNFAFAEFRSVEEASNAMGLDGVAFKDTFLKVRRPSNYDLATSLMLGPITPDPTMDVSKLNLSKPIPEESPNKLFVGGLPCEWPEQAVRLILEPWGAIKHFNLVMDKATGNSKGYAFCEFVDESVTDSAIAGLNGQRAGTKTLTVKRAAEGAKQSTTQASNSGHSPVPTPSQPSSFDDTGANSRNPLSPTFPGLASGNSFNRKSGTSQSMTSPGNSQHGASNFMMAHQGMPAMMMAPARGHNSNQPYMPRSHDMAGMQPMMQPYMGQPMHMSPGGFGAMMMAPGPVMMQSPGSYQGGSMDQYMGVTGLTSSSRNNNKPQRQHSNNLTGGSGSGNWAQQVMQSGLVAGPRPAGSKPQE